MSFKKQRFTCMPTHMSADRLMVGVLSLSVAIVLGACVQKPAETTADSTSQDATSQDATSQDATTVVETPSTPSVQTVTVTNTGFGDATLCVTPDELQQALPDLVVGLLQAQGLLVDAPGVEVTDTDGNLEFYALTNSREPRLNAFMTDNPKYQTAEGVGPGTLIDTAVSQYGSANLAYNMEAESREFVSFENGPIDIAFRTGSGEEAGVYTNQSGSYRQTSEYKPDAKIKSIYVSDTTCHSPGV